MNAQEDLNKTKQYQPIFNSDETREQQNNLESAFDLEIHSKSLTSTQPLVEQALNQQSTISHHQQRQTEIPEKQNERTIKGLLSNFKNKITKSFKCFKDYLSMKDKQFWSLSCNSMVAFYFWRTAFKLNQNRKQVEIEEQLLRKCSEQLDEDSTHFYLNAKIGEKVITKGTIYSSKIPSIANQSQQQGEQIQETVYVKSGTIQCVLDQNLTYSYYYQRPNKQHILQKLSLAAVSLFNGSLLKSKISLNSDGFSSSKIFYLFGKKTLLKNGISGISVEKAFFTFDFQRYPELKKAFICSIALATGIGIYYSIKLIKDILEMKRKKDEIIKVIN